ncbi:MAG: hypothetical protein LBB82_06805 [Treponema sp.]|jgi:hypothetical protein|nr:hypothetical protein [Treponema sp.]
MKQTEGFSGAGEAPQDCYEETPDSPRENSFGEILDRTCGRLEDKNVRHSLKRIQKMEAALDALEINLGEILDAADRE